MKRKLFLLIFLSLSIKVGHSQGRKFGLMGGANYSNVFGDFKDNFDTERRISYHIGAFSFLSLSDRITFSPRVAYSSQGYHIDLELRQTVDEPPTLFELATRLNYLNVPLLFKYYLKPDLSINFGPQLGFLLNTLTVNKDTSGPSLGEGSTRFSGDFKIDYGLKVGAAYAINQDVFVELNYFQGFSNISRDGIVPTGSNDNSVYQLSVGYFLF